MHRKRIIAFDFSICSRTLLLYAAGGVVALAAIDVRAQVSGTVSLVSDYRFRGLSLSSGRAEPQLSLAYDSPGGWYAGLFGSNVKLRDDRDQQVIVYAGYSRKWLSGLSTEFGVTASSFLKTSYYNYAEAFVGVNFDELSSRLYVSPNYFGQSIPSAYWELNASHQIAARTHLLAHIGYLRSFSGSDEPTFVPLSRVDALLGMATSWGDWGFQLAWTGTARSRARYPSFGSHNSNALVFSAAYSF